MSFSAGNAITWLHSLEPKDDPCRPPRIRHLLSPMTSRPLFIPLLGAVLGLSLAGLYDVTVPLWGVAALTALALGAVFTPTRHLYRLLLFLVCLSWGILSLQPYLHPAVSPATPAWYASDQDLTLEGIIDERPEGTETGCRVIVQAERLLTEGREVPVAGRVLVLIRQGRTPWVTGDRVRFVAKLRRPRNFGLPGEFDYVRSLALRAIHVTTHLPEAADLVLVRARVGAPAANRMDRLARQVGERISRSVPGEEGGVLRALLIGDRGAVPKATETAYARAGVNHILSISGFHVAIVGLALAQLLTLLGRCSHWLMLRWNLRRLVLVAGVPVIVFYLFLSGAAPATARSVVMIALGVLALCMYREIDPLNILIVSALLLIGINPPVLFNLSFQLSFLALWGLIVVTPLFMTPFKRWEQGRYGPLLLLLAASAAAVAVTLIPVAYYFHRTTVVGILANLVIVPLMGYGAVVLGFAALPLLVLAPPVGSFLLTLAGFLVYVSDKIIFTLARLPLLPPWSPTRLDLLLFFLLMTALTFLDRRACKIATVTLLSGIMLLAHVAAETDPQLKLSFFSIGQAEATLIRFPDGMTMLVDGGGGLRDGGADLGERLLAPALWSLGIDRVDLMVLTHPHPDHLKGLRFIVENFPVGRFMESGLPDDGGEHHLLHEVLRSRGVPVETVDASTPPVPVGEALIEFLAPERGAAGRDVNDDSLVFRLTWRELAFLFTGDIGVLTEERLLEAPHRLRAHILKVAHHGSRYSSSPAFLAAVRPEMALISAGFGNTFHLPAQETLERLARQRVPVYRTDHDGTITVSSSGKGFRVATRPPRQEPVQNDSRDNTASFR